jgi:hypothetical protein
VVIGSCFGVVVVSCLCLDKKLWREIFFSQIQLRMQSHSVLTVCSQRGQRAVLTLWDALCAICNASVKGIVG